MNESSALEESLDLSSFEYDDDIREKGTESPFRADLKMEHFQSPSATATSGGSSVLFSGGDDGSSSMMPLDDLQERLGHCSRQLQLVHKALSASKDLTDGFDETLTAKHFLTPKSKERGRTHVSPSKRVSSTPQHHIDATLDLLEELEDKGSVSRAYDSSSLLTRSGISRDGKLKSEEKESLLKSISNLEQLLSTKSCETRKLYDQIRRLKGGLAKSRDRNTILTSQVNELKHDLGSLQVQIELSDSQISRSRLGSGRMHAVFRSTKGMEEDTAADKTSSFVKLDHHYRGSRAQLSEESDGLRMSQLSDMSDLTEGARKLIERLVKKTEGQQSMLDEKDMCIHELHTKVRQTQEMLEVKECHVQQLRNLVALRNEEMELSGAKSRRKVRRIRK
jgi:hypothetical protein